MATAMAGAAMDAAKVEAAKLKHMVARLQDGPVSIKIMSYIGGCMLIFTGFFSFVGNFFTLHPIDAVVHLYMLIFGAVILLIESQSALVPSNILVNIHKYCAFMTMVWGRGAFMVFAGTLALAQWHFLDIIIGFYLVIVGAGMIYWGEEAYKSLDALMAEMKNPETVKAMFNKFDDDGNNVLDAKELGNLLASLGAKLRPTEVEAAVMIMDRNQDGKISLDEFQAWWSRYDAVPTMV